MPERAERKTKRAEAPEAAANDRGETFEQAFTRLEETVRRLEAGQLTLDEATKLYEEGMRLARRCSELLSAAELKITRLQTQFAEQMSMVDGGSADDDDDEDSK